MYSKEKLHELQEMDRESYQYYYEAGPKPDWSEEQWEELRLYQSQRLKEKSVQLKKEGWTMDENEIEKMELELERMEMLAELSEKQGQQDEK